jgi:hypothetical protein
MNRIWPAILRLCPTWFLQRELSGREGVTAECLGPEDTKDFHVGGPCWITINRD